MTEDEPRTERQAERKRKRSIQEQLTGRDKDGELLPETLERLNQGPERGLSR